ncbi:MAG: Transposase, partial [Candidatus Berkelbacteria bacterium Athens1014_28]
MTSLQKISLLRTREKIFDQIDLGELSVKQAAAILGLSRQAIWYRRKQIKKFGPSAALPLKPGLKSCQRAWNRTDREVEEKIVKLREETSAGPTPIMAMLLELGIKISRQTVYRILVRKKIII